MLFYIYSDAPGSTIDITDRCRLTSPFSVKDQAEEGSVALSSLVIDDPDGDLEITGHRRIYIYESEAPAFDQVVFNGFVANEREMRGPYRTGAGSQWTVDLSDPNVLANRRIMNGTDANRPAETDVERMTALMAMTELNTVDDSLYFSTADPVDMDAVDYRGQNVGAYIDDCRQASGKNAYIWYNEAESAYSLWYDFSDSTEYDSGCFLTNGIGEANGTTVFEVSQERTYLNHDPSRVASGVYLDYDGGSVYVESAGTLAQFAAIDWAAPSLNVKSAPMAYARANRYLEDASTEQPIIHTVMTKVPRRSVNAVKKGQLVSFKSSWMATYTGYTVCRVLYRTVTEMSEDPENSFEIEMDLVPLEVIAEPQFAFKYELTASLIPVFENPTTPGSLLIAFIGQNASEDEPDVFDGPGATPWTKLEWGNVADLTQYAGPGATASMGAWWRRTQPGEVTTTPLEVNTNPADEAHGAWLWEYPDAGDPTASAIVTYQPGGDFASVPDTGGVVTISLAGAYIIGAFAVQMVNYAFGLEDPPTVVEGTTLYNTDLALVISGQLGEAQYISPPWVWMGESTTGQLAWEVNAVDTVDYNLFAVVGVAVTFVR